MTTALLQPINETAEEWHAEMCRLAAAPENPPNGAMKRLRDLQERLDDLWERRRRLVARWFACSLGETVEQAVPRPGSGYYHVSYREYQHTLQAQ